MERRWQNCGGSGQRFAEGYYTPVASQRHSGRSTLLLAPDSACILHPLKVFEFRGPLGTHPNLRNELVKLERVARASDLAECDDRSQCAPLQLCSTFQVLFDSVFRDRCSFHRLLQERSDLVKPLRNSSGGELRQPEEHHVADDLYFVRIVVEPLNHPPEELMEVELR